MGVYCVTGGTGYIAAYLVKALLEKAHTVRVTVRDPENVEKVGFLWRFEGANERLKLMKADLVKEGSFNEAVEGVDGVFHTASPVVTAPYDDNTVQETLIDPAVKGTINVLTSCIKSTTVKRVVLTSSIATLRYRYDNQQISALNDSHWTDLEYGGSCPDQFIGFAHIDDVVSAHILSMEESKASGRIICSGPAAYWFQNDSRNV